MSSPLRRSAAAALAACCLAALSSARAVEPVTAKLPLTRVVLYSSGVGLFHHAGQVTGNAQVELRFHASDINDLLKSMIVQDLDGGRVSTVSYASKDPLTKTLKTFSVDLTENPTLADLLKQVRGERVEVEAPKRFTGVIVGVEKRKRELGKEQTIETDVLNLLTDEGLRSVPLETASRIKLANPQLDEELRKALAVLAASHQTDKKTVTLHFLGEGQRKALVAYIQETPVWKTSYRLALADDKPPLLQGWAIVENTTDEDWTGVELSLVSGRPISFTMDLYEPLYAPRPEEKLELYASLRPQVYEQSLGGRMAKAARPAEEPAPASPAPAQAFRGDRQRLRLESAAGLAYATDEKRKAERLELNRGVQAAARGGEVGELFGYAISTPVTIARQQSAMLPIVQESIKGEKLSIYNRQVQEKHPLNGLKLVNSSKVHLMQGPITVFDGETYAGDAMIQDIPPGAERLLSYALDLQTEVAVEAKGKPDQLVSIALVHGTMTVASKLVRTQEYTVRNSADKPKKVLIEQPIEADWKLVRPEKPAEKSRDRLRFLIEVKPGEPAKLEVEEERIERQTVAVTNVDDQTVQLYVSAPAVSAKVKTALGEIVKRKAEAAEVERKVAELDRQVQEITAEQGRIRQNMDRLDRTGDLYQRYVKKFSEQEDHIERIRTEAEQLRTKLQSLRKALEEYVLGLDLKA